MPTQNYYRILGTGAAATAREIEQGYLCQCTRLRRLAADPAMRARLVEVEAGYEGHSGPRARAAAEVRWHYHARLARSLNVALLACCLLLGLDWALPRIPPRNRAEPLPGLGVGRAFRA